MAAKNHSVGIDHVTVVPKPAAPATETEEEEDTPLRLGDADEAED